MGEERKTILAVAAENLFSQREARYNDIRTTAGPSGKFYKHRTCFPPHLQIGTPVSINPDQRPLSQSSACAEVWPLLPSLCRMVSCARQICLLAADTQGCNEGCEVSSAGSPHQFRPGNSSDLLSPPACSLASPAVARHTPRLDRPRHTGRGSQPGCGQQQSRVTWCCSLHPATTPAGHTHQADM